MASHFALFVDLENCGGKKSMLMDVIERVKIRGDILIGKVYGYTDSYSDLKEILLSNTFAVVPSLRFGRNQKNSLDIQLVIDALDVAYTNSLIDSFCIVSGDSDYVPLVGKLKTMGKFVLGISRSAVSMYETGNREPDLETLEKIAKFFNVDMNYLLGSSVTVTSDNPEPSYEDIEQMIARGSHGFSAAQKMKLIQLLSEIDL